MEVDGGSVSRRLFLSLTLKGQSPIIDTTSNSQKGLALGAGLSRLVAAWELNEAGHDVAVLIARNRPGKRVSIVRKFCAGEHTTILRSAMEGVLLSGSQAANQIHETK